VYKDPVSGPARANNAQQAVARHASVNPIDALGGSPTP